jgi:hypothetical protein
VGCNAGCVLVADNVQLELMVGVDYIRYRKLPRFTTKLPRVTFFPNLKSALFWSCPDLIIKEHTAAALALHGGHSAAIDHVTVVVQQQLFRQSAHFLGPGPAKPNDRIG